LAAVDAAIVANSEEAAFHALRGEVLASSGSDPAEVASAFRRAIELDATSATALVGLGKIEASAGRSDAALALYDRALAAEPGNAAAALAAAALLGELKRPDAAERRLLGLLERAPRQAEAARRLAALLLAKGRPFDARAMARRAVWLGAPDAERTLEQVRAVLDGPTPAGNGDAAS
jgi:tetratricopeptide (TPR) repeat protein